MKEWSHPRVYIDPLGQPNNFVIYTKGEERARAVCERRVRRGDDVEQIKRDFDAIAALPELVGVLRKCLVGMELIQSLPEVGGREGNLATYIAEASQLLARVDPN